MLNDLVMDVDLDFADGQSPMRTKKANEIIRDPISGSVVIPIDADKFPKESHNSPLVFKLGNGANENIMHVKSQKDVNLYPVPLSTSDFSENFINYICNLFDIYQDLGSHRIFSRPTIGVISSDYELEHTRVVNMALDSMIIELEILIASYDKLENANIARILELEQCLVILQCLRTFQFIDSINDRATFFDSLLKWTNRTDGEPKVEYIQSIFGQSDSSQVFFTEPFWKLVYQLLLRGLTEQAINTLEKSELAKYLKENCETTSTIFEDFIQLVKNYPLESEEHFREWKSFALELQQNFEDADTKIPVPLRKNLLDAISITAGNRDKILQHSSFWYESLTGFLLYYIPSEELIQEYVGLAVSKTPIDVTNPWETACLKILQNDIFPVLPILESLDNCTASFSAALCESKGLLIDRYTILEENSGSDDIEIDDIFSQRNGMASFLLNNFALELCSMKMKTLWPVAIGLISLSPYNTPSSKKSTIAELIPHYPFETNDDIEWALSVCAKWRLPDIAKEIYTTLGNQMLDNGNTVEAIANFSKAGQYELVKHYSWLLFENAAFQGKPMEDEVLSAIVDGDFNTSELIPDEVLNKVVTNAMRQSLSPYAVLSQFFSNVENERWSKALQQLMSLIEFEYLPKKYTVLLIVKYIYPLFLNDDQRMIDEETLVSLLAAIEKNWDCDDTDSVIAYEKLSEEIADLPKELKSMEKLIRKKLNGKLCLNLMI
ncbi:Nup85 Nucleoporin [Nakaseomyces glabratus]|nr:Nup85 Nucleoporin [Nakaseomyces glabratus]